MEVLQFAILGIGTGAVYALLAQGVIVVYKGSGIINFAQGGFGMFAAYLFYKSRDNWHWPALASFIMALAAMMTLAVLFSQFVIRPLQRRSGLARLVATLGLLTGLQSLATLIWGSDPQVVAGPLPSSTVSFSIITVPQDRFWLMGLAIVFTFVLWAGFRFTRVGLATTTLASSQLSAASFGWSPDALSAMNWGLGAGLAAISGILIAPLAGLNAVTLTLLVIEALAVALAAGFASFPIALGFGALLGIGESEAARYFPVQGGADAIAFAVVIIILVVRGQALPIRGYLMEKLPALGSGRTNMPRLLTGTLVLLILELWVLPADWVVGLIATMTFGLMLLSTVVLTGLTGQLSLAQFTLGGIGAFIAGEAVVRYHLPFPVAIVGGIIASAVVGIVFALPALRTRGVSLTVVTLAMALAISSMVLDNEQVVSAVGLNVGPQKFFGINIDPVFKAPRYAVVCTLLFLVALLMVTRLRRSIGGRRLIAIRGNERAAASLGISVLEGKLYGFIVAAGIAGLGGVLLGFASETILFTNYDPLQSVYSIVYAVLGGLGFTSGAVVGGNLAPGGIVAAIIYSIPGVRWIAAHPVLFAGLGVLFILLQNPDGIASQWSKGRPDIIGRLLIGVVELPIRLVRLAVPSLRRTSSKTTNLTGTTELSGMTPPHGKRVEGLSQAVTTRVSPPRERRVPRAVLQANDVTVRFGGVVAVDSVDLCVKSGEVVGLIGPNGAGKTTLLDAISGFVLPETGRVHLNDRDISSLPVHKRARAGLGRSFQSLELFDDITVKENLLAASETRSRYHYVTSLLKADAGVLTDTALAAVDEFGVSTDLEERPDALSFGRRHLIAIARAVATSPSILLLDEPVSGLDDTESRALGRLVRKLASDWGMGVLVVEHDMSFVMNVCDRVVVLEFGAKIAEGTPAEIRENPRVIEAYLGGVERHVLTYDVDVNVVEADESRVKQ